MQALSQNAQAVLKLLNAQREVRNRFDGSWWILDFAIWEIVTTLRGAEWSLVHTLIMAANDRRAEGLAVAVAAAVAA